MFVFLNNDCLDKRINVKKIYKGSIVQFFFDKKNPINEVNPEEVAKSVVNNFPKFLSMSKEYPTGYYIGSGEQEKVQEQKDTEQAVQEQPKEEIVTEKVEQESEEKQESVVGDAIVGESVVSEEQSEEAVHEGKKKRRLGK